MGLAAPWRRPSLGVLVWSSPSLSGAPAGVALALRDACALPLDEGGVYWLPPGAPLEALRRALEPAELLVVPAQDTAEARGSLASAARREVARGLSESTARLSALLEDARTPPARLIRTLDGLEALARAAATWSRVLGPLSPELPSAVADAARRVDAALTARLVA